MRRETVYSLGNFCYGGSRGPDNRASIDQLRNRMEKGELAEAEAELITCYVHTGSSVKIYAPAAMTEGEEGKQVLDFMDGSAKSPC